MTDIDILMKKKFQYGMRACGSMQKIISMNSLEGLHFWREKGVAFFEVDVDSDGFGSYVACHNFIKKTFDEMELDSPPNPDKNWFLGIKMYSKTTTGYKTMDLTVLLDEIRDFDNWVMMIDPKFHTFEELSKFLEILSRGIEVRKISSRRIIIETYNKEMIDAAKIYRFPIIHCVDEEDEQGSSSEFRSLPIKDQVRLLKNNDIGMISFPWKNAIKKITSFMEYKDAGFFIISKTRNDIFSDILKEAGVNINLVDYILEENDRRDLKKYREEYINENKEAIKLIMKYN